MKVDLNPILQFLACETPQAWLERAMLDIEVMLLDHASCEKKAASTAVSLMFRYEGNVLLQHKLSRLAREELRHFERVLAILTARGISLRSTRPGRYAKSLYSQARTHEPVKLIDTLIIGAIIEARSCERFAKLAPLLDEELQRFYQHLLQSEARHFEDYLMLAKKVADDSLDDRIAELTRYEGDLILSPDDQFYFHSGVVEAR
jgi:tRNA-(ms[2]io[6]A)-hydroxylase